MREGVIDALESTAPIRKPRGRMDDPVLPSRSDIVLYRDTIVRFMGELDPDLTVQEVREALEDYD